MPASIRPSQRLLLGGGRKFLRFGQASERAIRRSVRYHPPPGDRAEGKEVSDDWFFRYLDKQQNAKQSRSFSTKELALHEACSYSRRGFAVTSLEGRGVRLTGADVVKWCMDHRV